MTQDDALKLFEEEAGRLERKYVRQSDLILQLAQLLADSREVLSENNCAALVQIGAAMYRTSMRHAHARADIAATMREALESDKG